MADSIRMPRPLFSDEPKRKKEKCEVLLMGTNVSGIVLKVYKDRMEVSGYYESERAGGKLHANLKDPISLTWDQLEKAKQRAVLPPRVVAALTPDYEDEPTEEYLESLPVVTINGMQFYIDGERKERRAVSNPKQVFVYFKGKK